jgi:UDP-N-acetylglucosamine acyltransferase
VLRPLVPGECIEHIHFTAPLGVELQVAAMGANSKIHPSAVINDTAMLGENVEVGPFCVIGPAVKIGARTKLLASVTIVSSTQVGSDCEIHPSVVLGGRPQVHGFHPPKPDVEKPLVVIGDKCTIREFCSVHQSTAGPHAPTRVGNKVYIMSNSHIAHDCIVEDNVTIVTGVGLAGHCHVMDGATIGGMSGLHQTVRVGPGAFVAAGSVLSHDALPYSMVQGNRAKTKGLNHIGLKRNGWSEERIRNLTMKMDKYFRTGKLDAKDINTDVQMMLDFAKGSTRGVALPVSQPSPSRKAKM